MLPPAQRYYYPIQLKLLLNFAKKASSFHKYFVS